MKKLVFVVVSLAFLIGLSSVQIFVNPVELGVDNNSLSLCKEIVTPNCSLSEGEIESIAIMHNKILPSAVKNMRGKDLEELHASYVNYLKVNHPDGYEYFNLDVSFTQELFTFDVTQFTFLRGFTRDFREATQSAIDFVLKANSIEELNANLDRLIKGLQGELDACEFMALQVFVAVAKESAVYWSGVSNNSRWSFGKFIAADALGAYGGFLNSAVLAPVPGANAAIAGAAAFGAVWGSASYSLLSSG